MKVSDIVLAEYARVDEDGSFTLRKAGFANISADILPCVVPSMYLFLRFEATPQDKGINRLEIRLVGHDGTCLQKAEGSMSVQDDGSDPAISMPFHLRNTVFQSEGNYDFQVYVNGRLGGNRPLRVEYNSPSHA